MGDQCSKIIAALAQIVNAPQTDAQLEAEVIPRDFVMEKVVDIRDLVYAMRSTLAARDQWPAHMQFQLGDSVRKVRGSQWKGKVVGWYSTSLTPEGYAVESDTEVGSVQIYPHSALEKR